MKIVNIIQGTNLGGMEQSSLRLMAGLKERGHSCEVVSLNPIGGLGSLLAELGIPVKGLPYLGKWGWRSYFLLRRTLRSIEADAVLMTGPNLLAMLALGDLCRGRRLLAVHFYHRGVKPRWQWRLIYRIACSRFQAITFPSDFVRHEAEEIYRSITLLSQTVYNPLPICPLPTAEDRNHARLALGLPLDTPIIGNAGWLIPRKRFDVFLRTAQLISRQVPDALFLIAGNGEERARLEALARELNIEERVKWLGWQKNMSRFYQCLDVLLFNSDWDAMATTPLEAVNRGIPLVASNLHGGLKEILDQNDYGFLISKHDIEALAKKTVYFLQNPQEARKIALKGRERVAHVSNTKKLAGTIEALLLRGTPLKESL
ncbi:glycosyltransferase [Dolichospermum sp. ST_sed3]|nr:glycosyltransferase [Dolichospermum sp. ST_sed3]